METKSWYLSTTLQGTIVSALGLLVQVLKLPIGTEELTAGISAVFILIGIGVSIYGRIKTKGEELTK